MGGDTDLADLMHGLGSDLNLERLASSDITAVCRLWYRFGLGTAM